jgi:heme-degrading monooxygenase HmoA
MFVVLWQFQVKRGLEKEFEKVYGPEGSWVALFRSSPDYLGTRLLHDIASPGVYFTMDFWDSQASYDVFRRENGSKYTEIDRRCESLTESELAAGSFQTSAPPPSFP